MASTNIKHFTDSNFEQEAIKSALPVIVDFWAEWCGPCKMLSPILDQIADELVGKIVIGKLNVDINPQVASKYQINSIPTLLFIKNGSVADQHIGLLAKEPLKQKIERFVSGT